MPTNPPILPQGLPPHIAQSALDRISSPPVVAGPFVVPPRQARAPDDAALALQLTQARRRLLLWWLLGGILGLLLAVGPLVWVLVSWWLR